MAQKVQKVPDAKPDDLNLLPETPWWKERAGPTSCPLNLHTCGGVLILLSRGH